MMRCGPRTSGHAHYVPVDLHPYYRQLGYEPGLCPKAERLYEGLLTLPLYPKMSRKDVQDVIRAVNKVLELLRQAVRQGVHLMKIAAIVQARMGSSRLPGKVLRQVLGRPLLQHQLERMRRSALIDETIVATSQLPGDDPIASLCDALGYSCWRGSESDVLARYYEAAASCGADLIVVSPEIAPSMTPPSSTGSYRRIRGSCSPAAMHPIHWSETYPQDWHRSFFHGGAGAFREAQLDEEREHVTPYLYPHPELFPIIQHRYDRDLSGHRWTVDTPEDLQLVERIFESVSQRSLLPHGGCRRASREKPSLARAERSY